jgi:hypothetical protein
LAAILPLFLRRFQFPIPLGLNFPVMRNNQLCAKHSSLNAEMPGYEEQKKLDRAGQF